jgi:3-hydroxybutyrate dehydrogenase
MDGRRILVVGASSGVGAATARLADSRGALVVISGRRAEVLAEMASSSNAMVAVAGDVRDEGSARAMVDSA